MGELEGVIKAVILIGGIPALIIVATGISSAIQYMVSGRTPADTDDVAVLKERLEATEQRLDAAEEQTQLAIERADDAQAKLRALESGVDEALGRRIDTPTPH